MTYKEWKAALWEQIKLHDPCQEEASAFVNAESLETTWQVVLRNMRWLTNRSIDPGPIPPSVTHCGESLLLGGYGHPLPKGFTHCGGCIYLYEYTHPLPEGFTHCDGYLDLRGYDHPLPKSFTHCGGRLYLRGYKHPLPEGFKENQNDL